MKRNNTLVIDHFNRLDQGSHTTLSASIGDYNVWFKIDNKFEPKLRAEPFLATALLDAMCDGSEIQVSEGYPISAKLAATLPEIQSIYRCWNKQLQRASICTTVDTHNEITGKIASFFSAGIDSSYTLCEHFDEITHLVLLKSFDDPGPEQEWQEYIAAQEKFAHQQGKQLVIIDTNVRQYADDKKISWEFMHGLLLASIGSLFSFDKIFIPSSFTYLDLFPWGSHPVSDPMWSTENTNIVHHGAGCGRAEKTRKISDNISVMQNLHVCWRSKSSNCGKCSKCVRTMLVLDCLGVDSSALPYGKSLDEIQALKPNNESALSYIKDLIEFTELRGDDDVLRTLRKYKQVYELKELLAGIDRVVLRGLLRKLYRRYRKPEWLSYRVTLTPQA